MRRFKRREKERKGSVKAKERERRSLEETFEGSEVSDED
jgi:hypothetical protein